MRSLKKSGIHPVAAWKNYGLVMLIVAGVMSCNKEIVPANETNNLSVNTAAAKAKLPEIVVHTGGSIQAAVDAAVANSIIYIEPGVYKESILVNKPGIQMIGIKGNGNVVIQNPGEEENGIIVRSDGDGFVLKNITVRDFEDNGVLLVRVDHFLLEDVAAIDNKEYGLFPVLCSNGEIRHCSASGSSDTGIYVGQSTGIVITNNIAFANVSGFEIENCSNVTASYNESYGNTAGLLVFLLPGLSVKSSSNILVSHNKVHDNNLDNFSEPEGGLEFFIPKGIGILLLGADNTTIEHNIVRANNFVGIAAVSTLLLGALNGAPPEAFADIEPNPDGAKITHNTLQQNGIAAPENIPLPPVDLLWDGSGTNNCWGFNVANTSFPASLPSCQ